MNVDGIAANPAPYVIYAEQIVIKKDLGEAKSLFYMAPQGGSIDGLFLLNTSEIQRK